MKKAYIAVIILLILVSASAYLLMQFNNETASKNASKGDFYTLQSEQINALNYSLIKEYNKSSYGFSLYVEDLNNDGKGEIIYTSADDMRNNLIHILDSNLTLKSTCFLGDSMNGFEKMLFEDINDGGKKEIISAGSSERQFNSSVETNFSLRIFDSNCTELKEYKVSNFLDKVIGLYYTDIDGDGVKEIVIGTMLSIDIIKNDKIEKINFDGFVMSLAMDDINNDGKKEFVVGKDMDIYALSNEGNTLWNITNFTSEGWTSEIYVGDLYGDGKKEIVTYSPFSDGVTILDSEGKIIKKLNTLGGKILQSDLDGDGKNELIVGSYVYDNQLNLKWKYDLPSVNEIFVDDLNGDGKKEIVMFVQEPGDFVGYTMIYVFDANGNLLWNYRYYNWIDSAAIGDINNDNTKDILVSGHSTGPISIFGKKR